MGGVESGENLSTQTQGDDDSVFVEDYAVDGVQVLLVLQHIADLSGHLSLAVIISALNDVNHH